MFYKRLIFVLVIVSDGQHSVLPLAHRQLLVGYSVVSEPVLKPSVCQELESVASAVPYRLP